MLAHRAAAATDASSAFCSQSAYPNSMMPKMIMNRTGAPSPNSTATLPRRFPSTGRKALRSGVGIRITLTLRLLNPHDRGCRQPLRIVHEHKGVGRDRGVTELCADGHVIAGLLAVGTGRVPAGRQAIGAGEVSA